MPEASEKHRLHLCNATWVLLCIRVCGVSLLGFCKPGPLVGCGAAWVLKRSENPIKTHGFCKILIHWWALGEATTAARAKIPPHSVLVHLGYGRVQEFAVVSGSTGNRASIATCLPRQVHLSSTTLTQKCITPYAHFGKQACAEFIMSSASL